jgi:hypothetical protein
MIRAMKPVAGETACRPLARLRERSPGGAPLAILALEPGKARDFRKFA